VKWTGLELLDINMSVLINGSVAMNVCPTFIYLKLSETKMNLNYT